MSRIPAPDASSAQPPPMKNSTLRTYTAPRIAPGREPRPPITTIVKSRSDTSGPNESVFKPFWCRTYNPPASPAIAPEIANASSFSAGTFNDEACAAGSLSRTAMNARPVRELRRLRAANTTRISAASEKK